MPAGGNCGYCTVTAVIISSYFCLNDGVSLLDVSEKLRLFHLKHSAGRGTDWHSG